MMQKPADGKEFFWGTFGPGGRTEPIRPKEEDPKVVELEEEIRELKFQAFRRREFHYDPVSAEELLELARAKEAELRKLKSE